MHKHLRWGAIFVTKHIFTACYIQQTLVHMHGTSRLTRNRLSHKCGIHIVAQRCFTHSAFKEEHLIGQAQGLGVKEINFHLTSTDFMDQGVDVKLHLVGVVIDLLKQGVELVYRVDAVRLARSFCPTASAHRRAKRCIGIGVARGQVKLKLRRHDGLQPFCCKQVANPAQHTSRRKRDQFAFVVKAIMNHLRRGVCCPGNNAHGGWVRTQLHVFVCGVNNIVVRATFRKFTRYTHSHNGLRQPHTTVLCELSAWQNFASSNTCQVGYQTLDLCHTSLIEPLLQVIEIHSFCFTHFPLLAACSFLSC